MTKLPIYIKQLRLLCQLKILEAQFNACFRTLFLPAIIGALCCGHVLSSFVALSYGFSFRNLAQFLFMFLASETFWFMMFLGTLSGWVNKKSIILVSRLKTCSVGQNFARELFLKEAKACGPMKIWFANNFMSISTPLVMASVCIKLTVRLLLLV